MMLSIIHDKSILFRLLLLLASAIVTSKEGLIWIVAVPFAVQRHKIKRFVEM